MYAVVRNGHDAIYFLGPVDVHGVEALKEHVRTVGGHAHPPTVRIRVDSDEQGLLEEHAGWWLHDLEQRGGEVRVDVVDVTAGDASVSSTHH